MANHSIYEKKKQLWVDCVRVFATFSVVWLHSVAPLLYAYNTIPHQHWWMANIIDSMVRMSVPLFFMLTGYLLLSKNDSIGTFISKRLQKVVIPLIVWSIFYILWNSIYVNSGSLTLNSFFNALYNTLFKPAQYHLWFLYTLLGIYLYVPILRIIVQNSSIKLLYYLVSLWFIAVAIIPFIEVFARQRIQLDLLMVSGYGGYLILGHLLGQRDVSKKAFISSCCIAVVSVGVTAIGTFFLTSKSGGRLNEYFYHYLSPNVIFLSIATFIILKNLFKNSNIFKRKVLVRIINQLSSASLGIYMIHILFIQLFTKGDLGFTISIFSGSPMYSVTLMALSTFFSSFMIVLLLKKIPIINKSVP